MVPPQTTPTTLPPPARPDSAAPHAGCRESGGGGDAAAQPPPAVGHDDRFDVRKVLQDLEPDGAVAGHDRGVAERMHEHPLHTLAAPGSEHLQPLPNRDLDGV